MADRSARARQFLMIGALLGISVASCDVPGSPPAKLETAAPSFASRSAAARSVAPTVTQTKSALLATPVGMVPLGPPTEHYTDEEFKQLLAKKRAWVMAHPESRKETTGVLTK